MSKFGGVLHVYKQKSKMCICKYLKHIQGMIQASKQEINTLNTHQHILSIFLLLLFCFCPSLLFFFSYRVKMACAAFQEARVWRWVVWMSLYYLLFLSATFGKKRLTSSKKEENICLFINDSSEWWTFLCGSCRGSKVLQGHRGFQDLRAQKGKRSVERWIVKYMD